ncbi:MAG: NAD(P)/FAD-dependent oxidoreductase [Chitinophagales bacterium]|nr:NAD(P)/FAD-dependent oxidoreductase [Chitinophagales bacterium]
MTDKKRIIIVGGGFAGLTLAKKLNNTVYEILLIDKVNYHQFQPLFYQVTTAAIDPSNVSFPLRSIFHDSKNVRIRLAEVQQIIPAENKIKTTIGDFTYDYLVAATGADTNFFGNKVMEEKTYPMKSTVEALYLRYRILKNFEDALTAPAEELEGLMTYVIVGGGPTGVELCGAIAEMRKAVLPKDYPDLDFKNMKIILLEGSPKLLGSMSEQSSEKAEQYLTKMGVHVSTSTRVKEYDGKLISLENGNSIRTDTVIWAAGIRGNVLEGINPQIVVRGNRITVDRCNKVEGYLNIFALGDLAYMVTPKYPNGHPQVANVAINQAKCLADNLKKSLKNKPWLPFEYKDKGSMATVGKRKAVVDLSFIKFQGLFAWFVWMGLHLLLLMGMRNKIFVFIEWINAYFTNDSTLRLIFRPLANKKYQQ